MASLFRGILTALETRARALARVSIGAAETVDAMERIETYGLATFPQAGAECVIVSGDDETISGGYVLTISDLRDRPTLSAAGDVALWSKHDNAVYLLATGVVVDAAQIKLGSGATKNVALHGDSITASAALALTVSQLVTFANGIAPGTVTPLTGPIGIVNATATKAKAE